MPATSQLDWLISMTAMIVLFWSRATRDLLKSFGWGIAALHRLHAATKLPFLVARPIASFVRGHESAESRSIPGVAGSSRTGEGDDGGGLHHRYRGSPVAPRICAVCVGHRCDRPRPVPGVDAPAARRHPRRT